MTVGVEAQGGRALLRVAGTDTDTGIGIGPDDLAHVFDRDWRGENGRSASGSGIGLAVVQELVRAHRGTIRVASERARPTAFTVELPAVAAPG